MYLEIFLADFAVFRVFGGISWDFAEIPEFRGSATARYIRSPVNMCFLSRVCYFDISWDALWVMWWMGFRMNHTTILNIRCLMSHQPWNPVCLVFVSSFTCRTKESVWTYSWQSSWMLIMVSKENWRKFPTSGKTWHASQRKLNSG